MQQAGKLPNVVLDKIISHYAPHALGTTAAGLLGTGLLAWYTKHFKENCHGLTRQR